jgi:hypothetical protein
MVSIEELKNVVREPDIIELKPWKSVHDTITAPMTTAMQKDVHGSRMGIGFAHT